MVVMVVMVNMFVCVHAYMCAVLLVMYCTCAYIIM